MTLYGLIEERLRCQDRRARAGGLAFGRQAYVGLSERAFDTVTLGRQYASLVDTSRKLRSVEKVEANVSYNRETEAWMNRIPNAVFTSEFCEHVVQNVQGISRRHIAVQGNANHAGTTPTGLRHHAGYVAAAVVTFLRAFRLNWNDAPNHRCASHRAECNCVIPRKAVFTVDFVTLMSNALQNAEAGVKISTEQLVRFIPVVFNAELVAAIYASLEKMKFSRKRTT